MSTSESAVEFATDRRIHIALAVRDLEKSRAYYRGFEGSESAVQAEAILEAGRAARRSPARLARLMLACLAG